MAQTTINNSDPTKNERWGLDWQEPNQNVSHNSGIQDTPVGDDAGGGGLQPKTSDDFQYSVYVYEKDSSPFKPIKNAKIIYDTAENLFEYTNNNGNAFWESSLGSCFCTIIAQGYETITNKKIIPRSASIPLHIEMEPVSSSYYYKFFVKEKNTNVLIQDAQVVVKSSENGTVIDNSSNNKTNIDGSFTYCSDDSSLIFEISKNGYRNEILNLSGKDSNTAAESSAPTVFLTNVTNAHYYYVLSVKDNNGYSVSGVKFKFYNDFVCDEPYSDREYVTDGNGLISIDLGTTAYIPVRIFAKGTYIPSGYTWGSSSTCSILATLDASNPGGVIIVQNNTTSGTYYYNIQVVDDTTSLPVSGARVSYKNGGAILYTASTSSAGFVRYSSDLRTATVIVSKLEYNTGYENGITYNGSTDSTSCRLIKVYPKNTVQVVYDYDTYTEPAVGILVKVFTNDNIGNYMHIGTYKTNANGYIQNLNDAYYTSGGVYLSVVGYTRVYTLSPGQFVIKLTPPSGDTPDTEGSDIADTYNDFSANGIKKKLDIGNEELKNTGHSDNVTYNSDDFRINILNPESITTLDIFTSKPVMMQEENKNVIGSIDISLKPDVNDLRLKVINRYSGYYNPIFKDILFYNHLSKRNADVFPYTNTSFDYEYEDKYGKFGYINNLWFHKVNDNKDMEIIKTLTPYYPLTGQYALDYKDFNIFGSNWDMNYYTRQLDVQHSEPCQNISSMKNKPSMFGSKYLNVPEKIEITGLTLGNDQDWYGEWNDEWITNPDGCPGEMMFKEINDNSVDFYFFLKKRILRYFYGKLKTLFEENIESTQFSFGKQGIEDDIYEYVTKNVLKLYKLEKVRVFVRRTKKGRHNSRIDNDYTSYVNYVPGRPDQLITVNYLKSHGFVEIKNVTMTKLNRDDFDRKLVYNLWNGAKEDFSFSFVLRKI